MLFGVSGLHLQSALAYNETLDEELQGIILQYFITIFLLHLIEEINMIQWKKNFDFFCVFLWLKAALFLDNVEPCFLTDPRVVP